VRIPAKLRRVDILPLACLAGILLLGLLFLGNAWPGGRAGGLVKRQMLYIAGGLAAMFMVLRVDRRFFLRNAELFYFLGLVALVGVLFTRPVNGARSWFDLRFFKLQPSEFMKVAVVLMLATALARLGGGGELTRLRNMTWPLLLAFAPIALILKQPDLGTALIYVPTVFAMLYLAGAALWELGILMVGGAGGCLFLWLFHMTQMQRMRIVAWWDPMKYHAAEAYQYVQSLIAIGSGGVTGKGLGNGPQHLSGRVPEVHTDFLYAVAAEDWGFVGAVIFLALYVLLFFSLFGIAARARDTAGRLLASGLTMMLATQTLLNISVVTGVVPTTGVPLPFASYGGSSMLTSFIALGLILNVGSHRERGFGEEAFRPLGR